ncbi:MAG: flagellar basal body rod protein FlgC [Proteobacteria bacterium]|nr:flagellar basal body rod protein FlgC [Pseudomonadota bacterium]
MDLTKAMAVSASGLRVQGDRMRVIAENIANSDSTAPGDGEPYRRKVVTFKNELDRELGVELVAVDRYLIDASPFGKKYDPGHPYADGDGFVRTSNVEGLIEVMDMREAQRTYEANLNMISVTKQMLQATINLLKN